MGKAPTMAETNRMRSPFVVIISVASHLLQRSDEIPIASFSPLRAAGAGNKQLTVAHLRQSLHLHLPSCGVVLLSKWW